MKTILTFALVLLMTVAAQAQQGGNNNEMTVDTTSVTIKANKFKKFSTQKESNKVARLYKHKNSRILKALNFTTKKNVAKAV
ncbi:MAG: hypothetical protein V7724_10245 [Sediminicola sp.]